MLINKFKTIRGKFFIHIIGNFLFFAFFAHSLPIRFEENDDVIMLFFSSGKYSGILEPHLVFINYVYGLFLNFLYSIYREIEWYTVIFAIIHIISLSIISWYVINKQIKSLFKWLFLVIFYVIEIRFILLFQFTTTAALCALSGIILIINKKHFQKVVGAILLITASLIRFEATLLVIIIISPVFLMDFPKKLIFPKTGIYLFISFAFIFVFKYINHISYSKDKDWNYYQQFNKYRGQINDNPNAYKLAGIYDSDISLNDYSLLLNFFPDPKVFNLNNLNQLNKQINNTDIKKKISNIYPSLRRHTTFLLLITGALILLYISTKRKKHRLMLLIASIFFFLIMCYVSLEGILKNRVFFSALIPLIFVMLICTERTEKPVLYNMFILLMCCFILIFSYRTNNIRNKRNFTGKTFFNQQTDLVENYLQKRDNSLVPYANSLALECYPPFRVSKLLTEKKIYFSGWLTNIPLNKNIYDSYLDLIDRHAIFIQKKLSTDLLSCVKTSILINYGIKVKTQIELESEDYVIVKFYAVD